MPHRIARALSLTALLVALACISAGNASAVQMLAKVPPGISVDGPFPLGNYTYIQRAVPTNNSVRNPVLLQRINSRGHAVTVARRTALQEAYSNVQWFGMGRLVAGLSTDEQGGDQGFPYVYKSALYAGTKTGQLQLIDKCPAGPVVVHFSFIAELSLCGVTGHARLQIFRMSNGRLRLSSAVELPAAIQKQFTRTQPPISQEAAVDVNGDSAAVVGAGHAIVFSVTSGLITTNRNITSDYIKYVHIGDNGSLTFLSRSEQHYESQPTSGITAAWQYDIYGPDPRWMHQLDSLGFDRANAVRFYLIPDVGNPAPQRLQSVGMIMGDTVASGWSPTFSNSGSEREIGLHADNNRVVFAWTDCYWDLIANKSLPSQFLNHPNSCPARFIKRTARMKGHRLSVQVKSAHGFRDASIDAAFGPYRAVNFKGAGRPGKHRVFFKLSDKQRHWLQRHPAGHVKFSLRRWFEGDATLRTKIG